MTVLRKSPIGIQSFESIRRDGYLYVDKTALVYKMITRGKPYFLSRPRRFGKSLLCSTLAAVFEGRRELFEAFTTDDGIPQPQLFIATTNWKWEKYPVLRFDFGKGVDTLEDFDVYIYKTLSKYEKQYGITPDVPNVFARISDLIETAHKQTGHRVVVICDEYDNMMLRAVGDPVMQETVRSRFKSLFGPLKNLDDHLQLVFITGISKFSQMGVFSTLNQMNNISMRGDYEAICGISEQELVTDMQPYIEQLAERNGWNYEKALAELKQHYDGYHFSPQLTDMYNPFSLVCAFDSCEIRDYWFESGTPKALTDMLAEMPPFELTTVDGVQCEASAFDKAFTSYRSPLAVLYQSGYLTIKNYDRQYDEYTLGFPNKEVSRGFANCLYQYVTHRVEDDDTEKNALMAAYKRFFQNGDLPQFIQALQTFFAGVPYLLANNNERHYHALLYTLLVAFGADVSPEEMSAKGRADIVLKTPIGIYIFEIKYDHPDSEAVRQIVEKRYAEKYALDGRTIFCIGLSFSSIERNITSYEVITL